MFYTLCSLFSKNNLIYIKLIFIETITIQIILTLSDREKKSQIVFFDCVRPDISVDVII